MLSIFSWAYWLSVMSSLEKCLLKASAHCLIGFYCWYGEGMAPHSSTLATKIPWTEKPGRLQSMRLLRVGHDWVTSLCLHFHALEKEMATHSSVLAWRMPGTGESGGLLSLGSHGVGQDWSDLVVVVLLLSCTSCLYILEIKPLSVASFANIFSHSIGCLFVVVGFLWFPLLCKIL